VIKVNCNTSSNNAPHFLRIEITQESIANFTELINRALNCWDGAPEELKQLGDMITHGYITQDHSYKKINSNRNADYHTEAEFKLISRFIEDKGLQAWLDHIMAGTINKVLRPGS